MTQKKQRLGKIAGFIVKLTEILKKKVNQDVVAYNLQQKSFTIKNVRMFTEQILPRYFKHRNYSSFVRQVNLYDFHKIRQQAKQQTYNHPFFQLGKNKQLKKIKRKPMGFQKNRNNKKDKESQSEDQFHEMQEQPVGEEEQKLKSSEIRESSKNMNNQIQQLQRKKFILQGKIRVQQMANDKLQGQNFHLKNSFMSENLDFYKEVLKILQNIVISQYNQGQINRQAYDKLVKYIYQQQYKLIGYQNQTNYNKQKGKTQQKQPCYKQSNFLSLIKQLLSKRKVSIGISFFVQMILKFTQKQENLNHPVNDVFKEFIIQNSQNLIGPNDQKQPIARLEEDEIKLQKSELLKTYKIELSHPNEKGINQTQRRKVKKQPQQDKQYIPKHR